MKNKLLYLTIVVVLLILGSCNDQPQHKEINIIPQPSQLRLSHDYFKLNSKLKIVLQEDNEKLRLLGEYLALPLRKITGFDIPIILYKEAREVKEDIILSLVKGEPKNNEGYQLKISKEGVIISSSTGNGIFYGIQSFLQLIPPDLFIAENVGGIKILLIFVI